MDKLLMPETIKYGGILRVEKNGHLIGMIVFKNGQSKEIHAISEKNSKEFFNQVRILCDKFRKKEEK